MSKYYIGTVEKNVKGIGWNKGNIYKQLPNGNYICINNKEIGTISKKRIQWDVARGYLKPFKYD